jgi:L-lactate dehydrogenase complex protein LldE
MKVSLFIPCFVDAFYPDAGMSIVRVLEKLGHDVEYPEALTCCGQPAFNSGYWDEARSVAVRVLDMFRESEAVVIASGSCGAMVKVFYPQLFENTPHYEAALALGAKTWEFSDFLVSKLGVTDLGAKFPHKITFHDGCHGLRELNIQSQPRQLLAHVEGLELVEMAEAQTCCGFGGAFAAKFASISTAMGEVKADSAKATGAEYLVSNDSSCTMHIQGLLKRQGSPIKCLHLAQVLASTA